MLRIKQTTSKRWGFGKIIHLFNETSGYSWCGKARLDNTEPYNGKDLAMRCALCGYDPSNRREMFSDNPT